MRVFVPCQTVVRMKISSELLTPIVSGLQDATSLVETPCQSVSTVYAYAL